MEKQTSEYLSLKSKFMTDAEKKALDILQDEINHKTKEWEDTQASGDLGAFAKANEELTKLNYNPETEKQAKQMVLDGLNQ
jgi:hypothetical protein